MHEATLPQALATVEFIINRHGKTSGVFLPLAAWETVLTALEDVEDIAVVKDFLTRRATSRSPAEMGLLRWEDVEAEWDDGKATEA